MARLIAIGEINRRFSKLEGLIEEVIQEISDTLVFFGDYIVRGPKSYHVAYSALSKGKFSLTGCIGIK